MSHTLQVSQTVLAFAAVVLLCLLLKNRGIIRKEHGPLFAQLLTQDALAAEAIPADLPSSMP